MHCDLRVRWKVASDLRFRAAISEPKSPSFSGISGDLAPSTRKSLAIAIVRFWCAKLPSLDQMASFVASAVALLVPVVTVEAHKAPYRSAYSLAYRRAHGA